MLWFLDPFGLEKVHDIRISQDAMRAEPIVWYVMCNELVLLVKT